MQERHMQVNFKYQSFQPKICCQDFNFWVVLSYFPQKRTKLQLIYNYKLKNNSILVYKVLTTDYKVSRFPFLVFTHQKQCSGQFIISTTSCWPCPWSDGQTSLHPNLNCDSRSSLHVRTLSLFLSVRLKARWVSLSSCFIFWDVTNSS